MDVASHGLAVDPQFLGNPCLPTGRPFRAVVEEKLTQGLTGQRIHQDLVDGHSFAASYFKAGKEEGEYLVEATAGGLSAQTTVAIAKEAALPPPPPPETKTMRWSGEVPPQKWMNFYTKVLAKHATSIFISALFNSLHLEGCNQLFAQPVKAEVSPSL